MSQHDITFINELGAEFDRLALRMPAGQPRRERPRLPRLLPAPMPVRKILLVTLLLLLPAALAVATATGVWDPTPPEPSRSNVAPFDEPLSQVPPGAVDGDGRSTDTGDTVPAGTCSFSMQPQLSGDRPAPELTQLVSSIRDPREAGDVPKLRIFGTIHTRHISRTTMEGVVLTLVPVTGDRATDGIPNTPECERFRRDIPAEPRLCLAVEGENRGDNCVGADAIRRGRAYFTEDRVPGDRSGLAWVYGIAPDGVTRVRLTFHPESGLEAVEVPVANNVFVHGYNGSAAVPPEARLIE